MDKKALAAILAAHLLWLKGDPSGSRANLSGANLSRANLSRANLSRANLSRAHLSGANLYGADLSGADLYGANLSGADLYGANLYEANLYGANLYGADLYGADLSDVRKLYFQIQQEGELIGYKKLQGGVIAKLRIPPEARRTATPVGRKCRAEYVEVLEGSGRSLHDPSTIYEPGSVVRPDAYDPDFRVECTNGIHFFLTREEAEAY